MTDINELAQRMKAAALKAIADEGPTWYRIEWDSGDYSSHAEHELRAATVDEPRVYKKLA